MFGSPSHLPASGRLRVLAVLLVGFALSLATFFQRRAAYHDQTQIQFEDDARDRSESVFQGFQHGFEDVAVLRNFYESSDEVTRADFDAFVTPTLARHPYIQALQWVPEVTPQNRAALEAEARRIHPEFRFFRRDAAGQTTEMPQGPVFHAIQFVAPYRGNEVTLGYCAEGLATRQEALARALRTGELAASGGIRLIQETENQTGVLVMIPVRGKDGRARGVVQGVFRMGDMVRDSKAFLEPRGLSLRVYDATALEGASLLHEEPSRLPPLGPARNEGLHLARTFELAGRRWTVAVTPAGGHYALGTPLRAWSVLLAGLAFSALLAGYVRTLLASEAEIRTQVEARTRELVLETESHLRDARALSESEARFRQLVEVMGEGMWVLDSQGLTTFVNRRMAEMLGYTPAEMAGRSLFEFVFEEDVPQARRNMADRHAGASAQHDFRFRRKDGGELWTIVSGTPVVDEEGRTVSVLGIVTDITQRRREERAQQESQKLESLGVLAGGIAHDFNNLLTAILGNVNLAQLCLPKMSPAWPYLDNMERTVQRATNLTRQMLAYSGKGRFMVGPVDLNQAVEEIAHLLGVSISKKVALRFQLQPGLPVLMGEATQIQQVVMNLVTNASEAIGDAEGIVSIRTGVQAYSEADLARDFPLQPIEPGALLCLEVADTGQGMSPEVQSRIFEPFFTTKFTGRGLGLSAMQGIVRSHKGGIRVYSEVGKGTTFKLVFPAGISGGQAPPEVESEEAWRGSGTILVVDDEEGVRMAASGLLQSMGFDTVMASDGLEAVERFREGAGAIRAVLMDLTMPHLDGVEAFRELRRMDPGCRVVLTSGYNEQDAVQDFLGKGLAGFVQKPFQRADLARGMRRAIEGGDPGTSEPFTAGEG
ncbi:MAG: CHASE domain-containing protein [Geothrix sp.]|nr:CHASE domain-containing protein [Geothrix sp.]